MENKDANNVAETSGYTDRLDDVVADIKSESADGTPGESYNKPVIVSNTTCETSVANQKLLVDNIVNSQADNCSQSALTHKMETYHVLNNSSQIYETKSNNDVAMEKCSDNTDFNSKFGDSSNTDHCEESGDATSRVPSSLPLQDFSNLNSSDNSKDSSYVHSQKNISIIPPSISNNDQSLGSDDSYYNIKWVKFREFQRPIIMQNENGPCPLIAIINVLLLDGRLALPLSTEVITSTQLLGHLGNYVMENIAKQNLHKELLPNQEQNVHDAMNVFHCLQTGLDVNVRFTGVSDFEFTSETVIFDLLNIPLYHGWLIDPQVRPEYVAAVGSCSYNQLAEKIVSYKSSDDPNRVTEALLAQSFLEESASQLTYHGLCELSTAVKEAQLSVFFRNNHFSTLYKCKGELFLLVTDQGFLLEPNVVWETLSNVEGDGSFVDAEFHTYHQTDVPTTLYAGSPQQIDHDYHLALSLQQEQQSDSGTIDQVVQPGQVSNADDENLMLKQQQTQSDYELALALQEETVREVQNTIENRATSRQQNSSSQSSQGQQKTSSCEIL